MHAQALTESLQLQGRRIFCYGINLLKIIHFWQNNLNNSDYAKETIFGIGNKTNTSGLEESPANVLTKYANELSLLTLSSFASTTFSLTRVVSQTVGILA